MTQQDFATSSLIISVCGVGHAGYNIPYGILWYTLHSYSVSPGNLRYSMPFISLGVAHIEP